MTVSIGLEHEIKLQPGPEFRGVELPGEELPTRRLRSVYYDTTDLRLARGSITLRRREGEGDEPEWQLKLGKGTVRAEVGRPAPTTAVPEELRRLLIAHTRGMALSPVATLLTTRRGVRVLHNGHAAADVVEDEVEVLEGDRAVASFDEIEIEAVEGDERDMQRLEKALRKAGAIDPDGRPKLFHALGLDQEQPPKRAHSARGGTRAVLQRQYRQMLERDVGTRLGDPEALHKQRVAVRRLRAQLRAGRPVLDRQWADDLRGSLNRVGRELGVVRDLDVLIERLERQAAELDEPERSGATDVVDRLGSERRAAHTELVQHLSDPDYISLLNRLEQAVATPRFAGHGSIKKRLRKEHRRMARLVNDLPRSPTDRQLHEVRIAGKRVRYAAELASACGTRRLKPGIRRAKEFQDVLGDHQDAVVATRRLTEMEVALWRPAARLAITALLDYQDSDRSNARAAAPRAWRRLHQSLPA